MRENFLQERLKGIGGSDIGAIIGVSPFATAVDVWMKKTGRAPETKQTESMLWGTLLEDPIAAEFGRRNGLSVQRINKQLQHPLHDWAIANIDRAIVNPEISKRVTWKAGKLTTDQILEVKTANAFASKGWGAEDSDEVPLSYVAQCQWYLGVTGAQKCSVAVLIGGSMYREYMIHRDDELIASMLEAGRKFWFEHVLTDIAPPATNGADVQTLFPKDTGAEVEANDEIHTDYLRLAGIKKDAAELADTQKEIEDRIKIFMADNSVLTYNGTKLVTFKASKESVSTDWESAFKVIRGEVEPEKIESVIAACQKSRKNPRRFVVTPL